jgi:CPA1 family monovalent cation:H+ antiporter
VVHGVDRAVGRPDTILPLRARLLLGISGLRGALSLAAALSLPLTVDGGGPFPDRGLIVFLAFAVIVFTLVGQGLALPGAIRALGLEREDPAGALSATRLRAAHSALARIERLAADRDLDEGTVAALRAPYERRLESLAPPTAAPGGDADGPLADVAALRAEALDAEREAIIAAAERGDISRAALSELERELDLEQSLVDRR